MFTIDEKLLESINERKLELDAKIVESEVDVAYASLGCTTCEAFTQ